MGTARLKRQKIMLPVTPKGLPNYAFMEAYMQEKEKEKLKQYQSYINNRFQKIGNFKEVPSLNEKEWAEFELSEIFKIKSGKRLTKADMDSGKKPFVGASSSNNGITEFVSNTNKSEDSNVLGVNYNGSVVENFYHPYSALFSDDVKRLSFKNIEGNKHLFLFVKVQILKQKVKYQYGYKFNSKRMKKQKIMLPVTDDKSPDYGYMENYMKRLEHQKLKHFFESRN